MYPDEREVWNDVLCDVDGCTGRALCWSVAMPPVGVRECHVSATATTWSMVVLRGGDFMCLSVIKTLFKCSCRTRDAAAIVTRRDHAGYCGVDTANPFWDAYPVLACALTAVCKALDMLMAPSGGNEQAPAVIRPPVGSLALTPRLPFASQVAPSIWS